MGDYGFKGAGEFASTDFPEADALQTAARQMARLRYENTTLTREVELLRKAARFGADRVPDGYEPIEAWTDGKEIVVIGEPPDDCDAHNCDALGCASLSHVIARVQVPGAERKQNPNG